MVILDEKGRLFGKLNIIDLLVLIVLLYGLYWGGTKIVTKYFVHPKFDSYVVVLRAENVNPEIIEGIHVGDKLVERSGTVIGTVIKPEPVLRDSMVYVQTREGLIIESVQPKLKDMDITVEVKTPQGTRVKYNTNNMLVGSRLEYDFVSEGMMGIHVKALCVSINKAGN